MATAIYYASSTGNTEKSAGRIRKNLSKDIKLVNISNDGFSDIEQYDKVISVCRELFSKKAFWRVRLPKSVSREFF